MGTVSPCSSHQLRSSTAPRRASLAAQGALGSTTSREQCPGSICLTHMGRKQAPGQVMGLLKVESTSQKHGEAKGDLPGKTRLLRA